MRITSGKYRGHPLASPRSEITHPMGDRERLALFNMLTSQESAAEKEHPLCNVLDVYAGTGALGLEALSRGATHVDFIENDRRTLIALRQNITTMKATPKTTIYPYNVVKYTTLKKYDLIFIDPPYDDFRPADFIRFARLLAPGRRLVLSHPATFTPESFIQMTYLDVNTSLALLATRNYARANISIFTTKSP